MEGTPCSVVTRLVQKAERNAKDAITVDTQRPVNVTLNTAEPAPEVESTGVRRFTGTLASQGRHIEVSVEWNGTSTHATFGLDADADGKLAPAELREAAVRKGQASPDAAPPNQPRLQLDLPLVGDLAGRSYGMQVRRYEDGVWRAEFTSDVDYRLGAVDLDGAAHTLLVIDQDDDAHFGTPGDVFAFLPSEQFKAVPGFGVGRGFTFMAGDAAILGEQRARLVEVDTQGVAKLVVEPAHEPLADELRRRRARAVAAHELALASRAAEFEQQHGVQPTPTGEAKIDWLWTLDATEPLARAKTQDQPLFLLFEHESDERCAQMDLYTLDHPLVVEAARGFLCARVAIDLDLAQTFRRFDVRLGPAYVFCAPDGRPLLFPDRRTGKPVQMTKGFKSPTEMAALLTDCADRLTHSRFDPSPNDRR